MINVNTHRHNAADLRPIYPGNELVKFADDTYLVIAADNNHTCEEELQRGINVIIIIIIIKSRSGPRRTIYD